MSGIRRSTKGDGLIIKNIKKIKARYKNKKSFTDDEIRKLVDKICDNEYFIDIVESRMIASEDE